MSTSSLLDISERLFAAVLVGAVLGVNRELHDKPAGLRTHALVALGAALVVVASATLARTPEGQADIISRVTQGVITGIGFLGAGVILRDPGDGRVQGLTTAAAIWITSLFGVACGAGAYREVAIAFVLVLVVLVIGGPIEHFARRVIGRSSNNRDAGGL